MKKSLLFLLMIASHSSWSSEGNTYFRHLGEDWPVLVKDESPELKQVRPHFKAQYRHYRNKLIEIRERLTLVGASECRDKQTQALESLLMMLDTKSSRIFYCQNDCSAMGEVLADLDTTSQSLSDEAEECIRQTEKREFLLGKRRDFDFSISASWGALRADAQTSLLWQHRTENAWDSIDASLGWMQTQDQYRDWKYRFSYDKIYQSGPSAFRFNVNAFKDEPFFHAPSFVQANDLLEARTAALFWETPQAAQRLAFGIEHEDQSWEGRVWGSSYWGAAFIYYLNNRMSNVWSFYLKSGFKSLDPVDSQVLLSKFGFVFEERRLQKSSRFQMGFQDRRLKNSSAILRPDIALELRGSDLWMEGLVPEWQISFEGVETPVSLHTLRAQNKFVLNYSGQRWAFPVWVAFARDSHEKFKTDLVFRGAIAPSYRLGSGFALELPMEWQNYWIQSGENQPSISGQFFDIRMKVSYEL